MKDIKLIAIDLDGTLLSDEETITEESLRVLRAAIDRGISIVIASGRRYEDVMDFSESIAKGQPVICANGGMACLNDPYACVYCECLPKDHLRRVVEVLEKEKCYYHVYCDDGSVMESRTANPGNGRKLNCYDYTGEVLSGDEMPKYVGDGALKVIAFTPDQEKLKRIRTGMEKVGGLELNASWWDNLEILEGGVNKGAAVRALAEHFGLTTEQIMAFGDNENDISMFAVAGLSVAMANADDFVKSKAKFVTKTNQENGVAYAIRKLVFEEDI